MLHRLAILVLFLVGILPTELNGWYNPRLAPTPWAFWTVEVLTWIVLPSGLVLAGVRAGLFTVGELGFSSQVRGRPMPAVLAGLVVAITFGLYHLDQWAVDVRQQLFAVNYGAVPFYYRQMVPPPGPATGCWRLLALLHLSITAGFVEEVLFRGMLNRVFPKGAGWGALYVVMSTLVFASVHWEGGVHRMWEAAVFGAAACVLFRLTGNLWPLVVAHVVVDFCWLT